ncbi:MAG: hypothetical protein M1836_004669 [Candelina mexicana]|nr:MAG: hypothetical protein M1836_004669 [Candelina mexicana]
MKIAGLYKVVYALIVASKLQAQTVVFSSFASTDGKGSCSGALLQSNIEDAADYEEDVYVSSCQSMNTVAGCAFVKQIDKSTDNICNLNVYSDKSCSKPIHKFSVTKAGASVSSPGVSWSGVTIECRLDKIKPQDAFSDSVDKGRRLFGKLQDARKTPNDRTGGDELLKGYKSREPNGKDLLNPPFDLVPELRKLNVKTDNQFRDVELVSGKNKLVFGDIYSPLQGVLIADNNDRRNDDKPADQQLSLSEALFWEYHKLATEKDSTDIKKLHYLFRHNIINDETLEIIKLVYSRAGKDEDKAGNDLEFDHSVDDFFALLASPNGRAAAYILTDHAGALGSKDVTKVKVLGGKSKNMYFTLG